MQLLTCASVSKRVFMQNLSHEHEFNLHEINEPIGEHISTWIASHEDSFWHRSKEQLRNDLFRLRLVLNITELGHRA